jgi:hypothetical protein
MHVHARVGASAMCDTDILCIAVLAHVPVLACARHDLLSKQLTVHAHIGRQPVLGQRSRPAPPPSGYKHLSAEQRAKLDTALAATAQKKADTAEGVRTEVQNFPL